MTCPFCEADKSELVSLFGSQLLLSQYRCTRCGSYFEGLREDRSEASDAGQPPPPVGLGTKALPEVTP